MRSRRDEIGALEVFEAGKPWKEADGDVCEAIDFCEYYGREMVRLDRDGAVVESPPGEQNRLRYQARGLVTVISPWNFPLAIPCGMVSAALVTGNAVLLKPAEQTPATAYRIYEAFEAAGLPAGVLSFLPGVGDEVGAHLVEHPQVAVIAFTGSKEVGLRITETAAVHRAGQRHVKRVIAEMGGKNALIVDDDADLDQAVPAAVSSAFGFAGQKCSAASRLVVLDAVYDELVPRLVGAAGQLRVGHPREMGVQVGPVIDADAHQRILEYVELGSTEGRVASTPASVPDAGWFVGPTIVVDAPPTARVAREEIFGPVLTVLRARDLDHALGAGQRHGVRPHRRLPVAVAGEHRAGHRRAARRQRVREPWHHRRGRRSPALRRLRALRRGVQSRRAGLPVPVPRSAGNDGEHVAIRVRARRGRL